MISLIRAELLKARKNLPVTLFTIGTLPALAFVLLNMLAILGALGLWETPIEQINWQEQVILALLFANQLLSQALFMIFAAVCFGGESRWNTWKNIVPRNHRYQIVLSKFFVIAIGIISATQLMALLTFIGSWEIALFIKVPFISAGWTDTEVPFAVHYFWVSLCLFFNFMIATLYTSIAVILTQSTSAGIILGVIISFADIVSQPSFNLVSRLLRLDIIASIPSLLPNYNIQNIIAWITTGNTIYNWSLPVSALILLVWILIGITVAVVLFQRRDID